MGIKSWLQGRRNAGQGDAAEAKGTSKKTKKAKEETPATSALTTSASTTSPSTTSASATSSSTRMSPPTIPLPPGPPPKLDGATSDTTKLKPDGAAPVPRKRKHKNKASRVEGDAHVEGDAVAEYLEDEEQEADDTKTATLADESKVDAAPSMGAESESKPKKKKGSSKESKGSKVEKPKETGATDKPSDTKKTKEDKSEKRDEDEIVPETREEAKRGLEKSLNQIAAEIGEKYLLRPFPVQKGEELIFADANKSADLEKYERPGCGFQVACRVAALIPHLYEFYRHHRRNFSHDWREELEALNKKDDSEVQTKIKKWQVAALMHESGRTSMTGTTKDYADLSARLCENFIIGFAGRDHTTLRNELSDMIAQVDNPKTLGGLLLHDAIRLDRLREARSNDIVPHEEFAYFGKLSSKISDEDKIKLVRAFTSLADNHARVIQDQQGYLFHKVGSPLVDANLEALRSRGPILTKADEYAAAHEECLDKECQVEHTATYADIEHAVNASITNEVKTVSKDKMAAISALESQINNMLSHPQSFMSSDHFKVDMLKDLKRMLQDNDSKKVNDVVDEWSAKRKTHRGDNKTYGELLAFQRSYFRYRWWKCGPTATQTFIDVFRRDYGPKSLAPEHRAHTHSHR